ncbi:MAG: dihydroorotase [Actinomycetes bacterium]
MKILLKNGSLKGEKNVDLLIENDKIIKIGPAKSITDENAEVIDLSGLIILPGLVDLHTHLREPGREDAETIATGSAAAARGGFTAVHAMANTLPVADTAGVVEQVWNLGKNVGLVDVYPIGAVTVGLKGEKLAELSAMADSNARVRIFSDDGFCVSDPVLMRRALEYVKAFDGVIAQHAQDPRLTQNAQMNESELSGKLGLIGWPAIAEEAIVARDVLLTEHVKSKLHICHASTAGTVEILRWAKDKKVNVTAEVTPHHLFLNQTSCESYNANFKVNPPLRTSKDVEELRKALAQGIIDVVATDHAPHPIEDKEGEWQSAAFGMTGLETALSVVATAMIDTKLMNWADIARVMSERPAEIGQLADHGRPIAENEIANLCIVDPEMTWKVDAQDTHSLSTNNPFHEMTLKSKVVHTIFRGKFTMKNGQVKK